jgi:hypothetical protein
VFAVVFLPVGYQTYKATVNDTLGKAVGSLVLGVLTLLGSVIVLGLGISPSAIRGFALFLRAVGTVSSRWV